MDFITEVLIKFLTYVAIISCVTVILVITFYRFSEEEIEKRKFKRHLKRERKEKIRLGIIRINKNDPYGEEDWTT